MEWALPRISSVPTTGSRCSRTAAENSSSSTRYGLPSSKSFVAGFAAHYLPYPRSPFVPDGRWRCCTRRGRRLQTGERREPPPGDFHLPHFYMKIHRLRFRGDDMVNWAL